MNKEKKEVVKNIFDDMRYILKNIKVDKIANEFDLEDLEEIHLSISSLITRGLWIKSKY